MFLRFTFLIPLYYFTAALALVGSALVYAQPELDTWEYWNTSDESNNAVIDHSQWQAVLTKYVSQDSTGLNLFDYESAAEDGSPNLDSYLNDMLALDPREFSQVEQYAYWVNLYNALTVDLIIDNYPVETVSYTHLTLPTKRIV